MQVHESVLLLIRGRASVVVVGGVNTQVLAEWGQCVYSRRRRGACHLDLRRGRSRAHRPWGRGLKLISPGNRGIHSPGVACSGWRAWSWRARVACSMGPSGVPSAAEGSAEGSASPLESEGALTLAHLFRNITHRVRRQSSYRACSAKMMHASRTSASCCTMRRRVARCWGRCERCRPCRPARALGISSCGAPHPCPAPPPRHHGLHADSLLPSVAHGRCIAAQRPAAA